MPTDKTDQGDCPWTENITKRDGKNRENAQYRFGKLRYQIK